MGVYNSDWLLNQIRGTANVVSKAFKFETLDVDLGQVEDDQGQTVDGNDYIDDLLIHEKYDQATAFIHGQLKRLTTNDYNLLVLPARTVSPPKRFTPRRLASESRPLRDEPPAFLCAIYRTPLIKR